MPKKPLSRRIMVGDIISFTFDDLPNAERPEPWIGTVAELKWCEWVNQSTGRWREGFRLGVLWEGSNQNGAVYWVTPTEWEENDRYRLVSSSARALRKG